MPWYNADACGDDSRQEEQGSTATETEEDDDPPEDAFAPPPGRRQPPNVAQDALGKQTSRVERPSAGCACDHQRLVLGTDIADKNN